MIEILREFLSNVAYVINELFIYSVPFNDFNDTMVPIGKIAVYFVSFCFIVKWYGEALGLFNERDD